MLRFFFLSAWRVLVKNKLNTVINLIGLLAAFVSCSLLFLLAYQEFSFDSFHQNKNQLYKLYTISYTSQGNTKNVAQAYPMSPTLKAELPDVVKSTPFLFGGGEIRYGNNELSKNIRLVSPDFFSMFSFKILSGNKENPLFNKHDIVLNASTSSALFGSENPIGKEIKAKIGQEWGDFVVSAIVEDTPENSTLKYEAFARIENINDYLQMRNNWNMQNHAVYLQIGELATQKQVESKLRTIVKKYLVGDGNAFKDYRKDENGDVMALKIAPLTSLHFDNEIGTKNAANKVYLYSMIFVASMVLFIACFNFVNLSIAFAFTRSKEIGVRKANGSTKYQIFLLLLLESLVLFTLSIVISLVIAYFLLRPFSELIDIELNMQLLFQPTIVLYILLGILVISLLAGGYPAWVISRFKVVESLKGGFSPRGSSILRNSIIAFQFFMASVLVSSAYLVFRQIQFLRYAELGYDQQSVISIPIKDVGNSHNIIARLREGLSSNPKVISVSGSSDNLGIGQDGNQNSNAASFNYNGNTINTDILLVTNEILKTLAIQPIVGRDFSTLYPADTSTSMINIIVTKSVADQFGAKSVNGLTFYPSSANSGVQFNIIGVIPDFHLHSLHQKVTPVTLMMAGKNPLHYALVMVKTDNPIETKNTISEYYKGIEPTNNVDISYLSENTARWYAKEMKMSTLFISASILALVLACLGLFAITALDMQKRYREIAIRKVLGASTIQINGLLVKNFMKYILVSFLLSIPLTWQILNKWLENFAYKTVISGWVMVSSGLLLIIIALVTISLQTIKASASNPVESLKSE